MVKRCHIPIFIFAAATALVGQSAMAAQVTGLKTFAAGTPAVASEVNGNFTAVSGAVNTNDTRLTNVENTKQNRVTGTCAVGSAVTAIAADGTVMCGAGADVRFGNDTSFALDGRGAQCTLGEILLFAGTRAGAKPATGQLLSISQNTALFSLLGTTYGGNGQTTFALPDLRAAAPNGLTYAICTEGIFPSPQ